MRISRVVSLLCLLAASSGCSNPSEIADPQQTLIVQAFLTPDSDPEIELRQSLPPERFYEGREDTVRGAEVTVSSENVSVLLDESLDRPGTYRAAADLLPIEEGETYQLEVRHEGRLLTAQTTVPEKARVSKILGDTITYFQLFGDLFGDLVHPGEFFWEPSPTAAGYVVIVEAVDVMTLPITAEPITGDLDSLIALRARLEDRVGADSLEVLDREIQGLRNFLSDGISLLREDGDTIRWLRDREQEDWDKIKRKDWSEGRKWRKRREELYANRVIDYWIPADSTRSDFWWLGVRFEGEYQVILQAADRNYFDYFQTSFNGLSGADSDTGPIFHVEGGTGVFGSYAADRFRVHAVKGLDGSLKVVGSRSP